MREYLKGWLGRSSAHITRPTKLRADIVGAGRCSVSGQRGLGVIPALLGLVGDEGRGIEIGLRKGEIEDTGAGGDCDRDGQICAGFGSYTGSEHGRCESGFGEHVVRLYKLGDLLRRAYWWPN